MISNTESSFSCEENPCKSSQKRAQPRKLSFFPVRLSEFQSEMDAARKEPLDIDLSQPADDIVLQNFEDSLDAHTNVEKGNSEDPSAVKHFPESKTSLNVETLGSPPLVTKPHLNKSNNVHEDKHIISREVPLSVLKNQPQIIKNITVRGTNYIVWNEIGRGGSSVVYHCFEPVLRQQRAIKCVSLHNSLSAPSYINEVKILQKLQKCQNIIKMFDYEILENKQTLYMVLEIGSCDLHAVLKDLSINRTHLPLYKLIYYWMEMLHAVQEIHDNGIIHSDLKPANFIQVKDSIKLIDFGIACTIQNDMTSVIKDVPEGSFNYISPEALRNDASNHTRSPSGTPVYKIHFKSDVWSLGCILYQFVYKCTPFGHIGHVYAKLSTILDPNHEVHYPPTNSVPQCIIDTIKKCLRYNCKARPSVRELIQEYDSIGYCSNSL